MNDSKTVLIVEQDPKIARAMTAHFEDLGYEVDRAPDGLDAIMKIKHERPRVVVMGLTTPRLGGVDALRLLQRWHPDLSVVLADSERLPCKATGGEPEGEWLALDRLVARAAAHAGSDGAARDPAPIEERPAGGEAPEPPTILVVDDVPDIRDLLAEILEAEGYAVETAADAATAIRRLTAVKPQVVLLDISMPGLSGVSALQHLRARDPRLGIIMITGNEDERLARQTLALGAFDYVGKPIDFDYLRRSIRTLLAMQSLVPVEPAPGRLQPVV